jgi:NADPH:quinone reductase-like Zn-dependent oxidoreductase
MDTVERMMAVRLQAQGGAEWITCEEAPRPRPAAGQALVRVHAAAITPSEHTWLGPDQPFPVILGHEFSGVVIELGPQTVGVATGDAVYGLPGFARDGAQAEYVVALPSELAPKPRSIDHVQAAEVPISGLTAWQALFDHVPIVAGQRILIHGGTGGVGAFAVQFAHWKGAYVITTVSGSSMDLARELGADEVVDYTASRYEEKIHEVDVALDTVGGETLERSWGMLRPGGLLISIVDDRLQEKAAAYGVRAAYFVVEPNRKQLQEIAGLIDSGYVRPLVEAVYPLSQAPEAYATAERGHLRGKIVLNVAG